MLTFDSIIGNGIRKIYDEDFDSQRKFLTTLIEDVRKSSVNPLFEAKAFFVPNSDYMVEYFGQEARSAKLDMYNWAGECIWDNHIVFPIRNIANSVVGLVGFDPIQKLRKISGERSLDSYYKYSSKEVFNRGKYIFTLPGIYEKSIQDKYAVLVDGVFDMLYGNDAGFNTISLMGSDLSPEVLMQLNFIQYLFVAQDNDAAGKTLYDKLVKVFPGRVFYLRQNQFKDLDDLLKSEYRQLAIKQMKSAIVEKHSYTLRLKPFYSA